MDHLHIAVFGHFEVTRGSVPVAGFDSGKVRALLVYLVVESDRAHARESLAAMLWPESAHRAALSNLRYALSNLRKTIGDREAEPPYLHIDPRSIAFNPDSDQLSDIHQFEQWIASNDLDDIRRAVELYRGDFLAGFSVPDSIEFEEWVVRTRERCRHLVQYGLQRLSDHYEQQARFDQAVPYALRLVELLPWSESGHLQLMRLYAAVGRRSEALAQFEACRQVLDAELGVEPAAEMQDFYAQLSQGVYEPPPPAPAFLLPDAADPEVVPHVFRGREKELTRLDALWAQVRRGQGRTAYVIGEAGSGKTMLVHEFARRLQDASPDVLVVSGRCNAQSGVGDPYLPFLECIRMLGGEVELQWQAGVIRREQALRLWGQLGRFTNILLGEGQALVDRFISGERLLARVRIGAPRKAGRLAEAIETFANRQLNLQQQDLLEQYTRVLQQLAVKTPLVVILDDLQWADRASLALLLHLGRRLSGHRIFLLGASRPEGIDLRIANGGAEVARVLNEFKRQQGDVFIDLAAADGYQFIEALIDAEPNRLGEDFRRRLMRQTDGHPLYTVELLQRLQSRNEMVRAEDDAWVIRGHIDWSGMPARVEAAISARVGDLPQPLRRLATAASVQGEQFTAEVLAGVVDLPVDEVIGQLSGALSKKYDLVTAEGVEPVNGRTVSHYRFRHILFRNYFSLSLDAVERARMHARVGEMLESLYAAHHPEQAIRIAYHYEQANMPEMAVRYLSAAAEQAVRLFANREAIEHYDRALALLETLPPSPQRDAQELRLRTAAGAPLLAVYGFASEKLAETYRQAHALTRTIDDPIEKFTALAGLHGYYNVRVDLEKAAGVAEELLEIAAQTGDPLLSMMARHENGCTAMYLGDFETFFTEREKAHQLYTRHALPTHVYEGNFDYEVAGLAHEAWALYHRGFFEKGQKRAEESVALAETLDHPFMKAFAYFFAANLNHLLRDRSKTRHYVGKVAALSHHAIGFWGIAGVILDVWADAETDLTVSELEHAREMFDALRAMGAEMGCASHATSIAELYAGLGRVHEGLALLDEGIATVERTGFRQVEPGLYACRGDLLQLGGDQAGAERAYREALRVAGEIGALGDQLRPALGLAKIHQERGEASAAYDLLCGAYRQFTEGFQTPVMRTARELLEKLESGPRMKAPERG